MHAGSGLKRARSKQGSRIPLLLALAGLGLLCDSTTAIAQQSAQDKAESAPEHSESASAQLESLTVTATRVSRPGYEAPTPTTVVGSDMLELRAPGTIADVLALLPSMRNAQDEGTGSLTFGVGIGRGFVNLRGLGPDRTLVLLDGERLVGNSLSATPDLSLLPSALVQRVEVVTGGASATYGSDAVAGVVNFVLEPRFTGLQALVEGGTSYEEDATQRKASLTWGGDLGEGLHLVVSGEYFDKDGLAAASRRFASPAAVVANPAYAPTEGQKPLIVAANAYDAQESYGGLILNGPLAGNQFLANGTTAPYLPSTCTLSEPYALCPSRSALASWANSVALTSPQQRGLVFSRLTLEVTPDAEAHVDLLLARSQTAITSAPFTSQIFGVDLPINVAQNPFLPAAVRNQYLEARVSTLELGRLNGDEGVFEDSLIEQSGRIAAGLTARLTPTWTLRADSSFGIADDDDRWINDYDIGRFLNAVDSVLVNGVPTCRINALVVTQSACSPANVFGAGNLSQAARAYFLGTLRDPLETSNWNASIGVSGAPLSTAAGEVSVAAGIEHRRDTADQKSSDPARDFAFSGYPAFEGGTHVTELYAEGVVPLARDTLLAHSMDIEIAARFSDYGSLGERLPWKLGLNWSPVSGIRFRATASEDIRAPNIGELYTPAFFSSVSAETNPPPHGVPLFDALGIPPGATLNVRQIEGGNARLGAEVAHTVSEGFVLEPKPLPGLTMSIDHYRIEIANAITELPVSEVIDACAAGNSSQCALIASAASSSLPLVTTLSVNAESIVTSGWDLEIRAREPLGPGVASVRVLANYMMEYKQRLPGAAPEDLDGDIGSGLPTLQGDVSTSYEVRGTTVLLYGNFIGGGDYDKAMDALIQNDHVPHVWYVGGTISQELRLAGAASSLYGSVSNLFNQAPPHPGFGIFSSLSNGILTGVPYDRIGRFFKVGLRVRF